jgi:hypothetical protein
MTSAESPENTIRTRELTSRIQRQRRRSPVVTTDYGTEPFVGHSRQGVAAFSPVAGAGDLTVGKAYLDGVWGSSLPGRVNFVGVWAGAMSFGQIVNLIGG